MPVLRVPMPVDPDTLALEVGAVEDRGATVTQVQAVGNEWWIVHSPMPQRRPASTKAKQTR
jgi:hypothetical protein